MFIQALLEVLTIPKVKENALGLAAGDDTDLVEGAKEAVRRGSNPANAIGFDWLGAFLGFVDVLQTFGQVFFFGYVVFGSRIVAPVPSVIGWVGLAISIYVVVASIFFTKPLIKNSLINGFMLVFNKLAVLAIFLSIAGVI
jgi:hypothetical protein